MFSARCQAGDADGSLQAALLVPGKVRYGDFTTLSRQLSLEQPLTEAGDIYRIG